MASKNVAELLAKEFVIVKIDLDRAPGADAIAARYQTKKEGLPWFAFIDATDKAVATSTGPDGNVGFPAKDTEYAHFKSMLEKARKHLTDADIAALMTLLEESNKK